MKYPASKIILKRDEKNPAETRVQELIKSKKKDSNSFSFDMIYLNGENY